MMVTNFHSSIIICVAIFKGCTFIWHKLQGKSKRQIVFLPVFKIYTYTLKASIVIISNVFNVVLSWRSVSARILAYFASGQSFNVFSFIETRFANASDWILQCGRVSYKVGYGTNKLNHAWYKHICTQEATLQWSKNIPTPHERRPGGSYSPNSTLHVGRTKRGQSLLRSHDHFLLSSAIRFRNPYLKIPTRSYVELRPQKRSQFANQIPMHPVWDHVKVFINHPPLCG